MLAWAAMAFQVGQLIMLPDLKRETSNLLVTKESIKERNATFDHNTRFLRHGHLLSSR